MNHSSSVPLLRRPELTDARRLAEIHVESWREAYRGLLPGSLLERLSVEDGTNAWRDRIAAGHPILLATENNVPQGFIAYGPARSNVKALQSMGEIYTLYVDKAKWRQGIGGVMLKSAQSELISLGYRSIFTWALESNELAYRFYEKNGFKLGGRAMDDVVKGLTVKKVCFVKRVS